MNEGRITLSKKYGLNPTIPVCFFCGQPKNEIALMGRLKDDVEAPKQACINYEPCEKCKVDMAAGYTLIGVTAKPFADGRPPVQSTGGRNLYPTGDWAVITKEGVEAIFKPSVAADVLQRGKCFLEQDVLDSIQEGD